MDKKQQFDFWYAVNNTQILQLPSTKLETFGNSIVNYHLLTELMDSVGKVRVREGRIETHKPQIIAPQMIGEELLQGFGDEAGKYMDWLRTHEQDLQILKYGFAIKKREINDHIVSENMPVVVEQLKSTLESREDPLSALLVGVDEPWEVCLLKLMVEVVQQSASSNFNDLRHDPQGHRHEIENAFYAAARDRSLIPELSNTLREHNLFKEYEDRFFALVQATQGT